MPVMFEEEQQKIKVESPDTSTSKDTDTDTGGTTIVPNLSDLLNNITVSSSLSSEGTAYFETIKREFEKPDVKNTLPVSMYVLNYPQDTHAFVSKGNAVILIPYECLNKLHEDQPVNAFFVEAYNQLNNKVPGVRVVEIILVQKEDYELAEKMARCLINIFTVINNNVFKGFTIESMRGTKFAISTSPSDVEDFISRYYPHKTPSRADFGFVLYRNKEVADLRQYFGDPRMIQTSQAQEPIACVTGYTDIINVPSFGSSGVKFLPLIHITDIISILPDFKMSAVLVPLAADIFITAGLWKSQFNRFSKSEPNLGSLFRDANTGAACFVDNQIKLRQYLTDYFEPPALVVDVLDGKYRLPGIEMLAMADRQAFIGQEYLRFMGRGLQEGALPPVFYSPKFNELVGTVLYNGKTVDSRYCDYLNTILDYPSENNVVAGFLERSKDPKIRVDLIKRFYSGVRMLFINSVVEVNLQTILTMQEMIRQNIVVVGGNLPNNMSGIDLSSFIAQGHAYAQSPMYSFGYQTNTGFGYINPYTPIYNR